MSETWPSLLATGGILIFGVLDASLSGAQDDGTRESTTHA